MTKSKLRRATRLAGGLVTIATCLLGGSVAQAHLSYTGRNFGTFSGLTNATVEITNQAVTGNWGWADAADGILGDSHRGRVFRFTLDNASFVTLTVAANPNATATSIGGLTPAFSIYSGLAAVAPYTPPRTGADHDGADASVAWRIWWVQQNINPSATDESPTDGSWNAVGDWKIGGDGVVPNDFAELSTFVYKGSAASTSSGGSVTGSFALPAGDYTIMIGGNDISNKTADDALSPRGASVTLSVSPTPVLSIAQKVFVAWPAGTPESWVLQSSPTLDGIWSNVTSTPVIVDGQTGVVLEHNSARQYFRFIQAP